MTFYQYIPNAGYILQNIQRNNIGLWVMLVIGIILALFVTLLLLGGSDFDWLEDCDPDLVKGTIFITTIALIVFSTLGLCGGSKTNMAYVKGTALVRKSTLVQGTNNNVLVSKSINHWYPRKTVDLYTVTTNRFDGKNKVLFVATVNPKTMQVKYTSGSDLGKAYLKVGNYIQKHALSETYTRLGDVHKGINVTNEIDRRIKVLHWLVTDKGVSAVYLDGNIEKVATCRPDNKHIKNTIFVRY